jgi:hypothetical protein
MLNCLKRERERMSEQKKAARGERENTFFFCSKTTRDYIEQSILRSEELDFNSDES